MKVKAIGNWFGSARMAADRIGPSLAGYPLVVIPFAGGMSEVPFIPAKKIIVNDLHRHVINLARAIRDPKLKDQLVERLQKRVFHPDELAQAQKYCQHREAELQTAAGLFGGIRAASDVPSVEWAEAYAISTWMGRGGTGGTRGEFRGSLPVRYSPNGGGSGQRFHNWTDSIDSWHEVFKIRDCEFTTDDAFDILEKTADDPKCVIYVDCPWPDAGDGYTHPFNEALQRRLATKLATFKRTRVVVRFADHPLVRELYKGWTIVTYSSRAQTNGEFDEILLINSFTQNTN